MEISRYNRYPSYYDSSIDDETLDNELASSTSDGLMSKEDKRKLDKLSDDGILQDIKASDVIIDEKHQFVSQSQIDLWNSKSKKLVYNPETESLEYK